MPSVPDTWMRRHKQDGVESYVVLLLFILMFEYITTRGLHWLEPPLTEW